mgnify:CR=1 FL=1
MNMRISIHDSDKFAGVAFDCQVIDRNLLEGIFIRSGAVDFYETVRQLLSYGSFTELDATLRRWQETYKDSTDESESKTAMIEQYRGDLAYYDLKSPDSSEGDLLRDDATRIRSPMTRTYARIIMPITFPNSWISWARISPDKNGQYYGHVAFVEAVGADGTILISECGSNIWNNGAGILVRTIRKCIIAPAVPISISSASVIPEAPGGHAVVLFAVLITPSPGPPGTLTDASGIERWVVPLVVRAAGADVRRVNQRRKFIHLRLINQPVFVQDVIERRSCSVGGLIEVGHGVGVNAIHKESHLHAAFCGNADGISLG